MKPICIAVLCLLICGCSGARLLAVEDEFVPTTFQGSSVTVSKVANAILSASQQRGWNARIIDDGLIEARLSVRSHYAVVEIPYSTRYYSILYKDSGNLDYRNGFIHRNYNQWIMKLNRSIQEELGVRVQKF